jgi:protein-disulfide isomerase
MKNDTASNSGSPLSNILFTCVLGGLAFSALLLGEYSSGGLLCSTGGGCDTVRASAYSSIAGVSLPLLGVIYFLALLAAAAMPQLRVALLPLAGLGALGSIAFIGIQTLVIGAFCPLCLVVDSAAIGAGVAAWMGRDDPAPKLTSQKAGALAVMAVAALSLAGVSQWLAPPEATVVEQTPSQLPGAVAREQKAAGPVTVVEYLDFECPGCRYQYEVFKEVLADVDYDVRMVYMHSPLPQHSSAEGAAKAYICAEQAGVAEAMADKLFTSDDISLPAIEAMVTELGFDAGDLRRCMSSEATTERLERDLKLAQQLNVRSLPTFWIGRQKFVGTSDPATVRKALDRWVRIPAGSQ